MLRAFCLAVMLSPLAFAQDKKPEVHLNHAFIVPDVETYEAIRNSEFVKQFAVWEERTTHRKDITYTGFYLYGRHTYFEFLKPDERTPIGTSKIAFGVDRSGDLDLLQKRAEAAGIKTEINTITRSFNGKDVDWFRSLDRKDEGGSILGIWTLEYVPTFLDQWNPVPGEKSSVRREDVLNRYAEVVKQNPEAKEMLDVVAIWVRVPASFDQIKRECEVLGLNVGRTLIDNTVICNKPGELKLLIRPATEKSPAGIKAIAVKLKKTLRQNHATIGKTSLGIQGDTAIWVFERGFRVQPESDCC
jgi:hypothetical protein